MSQNTEQISTLPNLTTEELEAVPVGLRIQDRDGDQLTRREGGYSYTESLRRDPSRAFLMLSDRLVSGPFTMAPLTPEEIDALPVGSIIADADGDQITRLADGWQYSDLGEDWPSCSRPVSCPPYTLVPQLQESGNA